MATATSDHAGTQATSQGELIGVSAKAWSGKGSPCIHCLPVPARLRTCPSRSRTPRSAWLSGVGNDDVVSDARANVGREQTETVGLVELRFVRGTRAIAARSGTDAPNEGSTCRVDLCEGVVPRIRDQQRAVGEQHSLGGKAQRGFVRRGVGRERDARVQCPA